MLDQAYACWQQQTYQGYEFIVVHDGTKPLVCPGREIVGVPGENLGTRRNRGLVAATGDVVAVWDDDDWSEPGRLAVQIAPLLRGHGSSVLQDVLGEEGDWRGICTLLMGWPQTLVATRAAIDAVGGYPENEHFDGDTSFMMDLLGLHNGACVSTARPLYRYRRHASNVTSAGHWADIKRRAQPLQGNECPNHA